MALGRMGLNRQAFTIEEATATTGVDAGTYGCREGGEWKPQPRLASLIASFLDSHDVA